MSNRAKRQRIVMQVFIKAHTLRAKAPDPFLRKPKHQRNNRDVPLSDDSKKITFQPVV